MLTDFDGIVLYHVLLRKELQ